MKTKNAIKYSDILENSLTEATSDGETAMPTTSLTRQMHKASYDQRVLQALRQIIRAFDLHSRHLLGRHKITGPQLVTLLTIEKYQPVTASAIAGHVYLSPSTVIGILDRLEDKGFIRRDRDRKDRRMVHISLTSQGKDLAQHAPSPLQERLAEAMNTLPERDMQHAGIAPTFDGQIDPQHISTDTND